jgi:hypothetical protein
MRWWGEPWPSEELRAPICEDDSLRTPTPLGESCAWCEEPILQGEGGVWMLHWEPDGAVEKPWHQECSFRTVMGSKAHLEQRCTCYGGQDHDDPNMTAREEAIWVLNYWTSKGELRP